MTKDWRKRDERRREEEERRERENQAIADEIARKDEASLDYIIEYETNDMEGVRYVLQRLARAQQLQLDLIKRNMK
ncbi:hypothetical protein [Agrobacterium sp. CG674]